MSTGTIPKMHNVRFYKPKPRAVYCMALQDRDNKLAISRSDASVEIWNLTHSAFIERTIASSTENFSIEGLAWCDSRLFSVGLHGLLIEYDLVKLGVKNRSVVTGEAAFCLDINKQKSQIAIGTEQGYLNIFQITEDEVLFEKFLDKQEGRILCLKFDNSGEFIVSGSMDAIRIWSVKTNQALHKMTPGRSDHNKPTIVWCLAITQDLSIISGDSRGILTVWDGKIGAQIESYQSHRADILSLCLSDDETSLYCAGVDPNVVNYVRIKVKDDAYKWVRSTQRKIHDHDVRALALAGDKLYSSGVDGYLTCSYGPPRTLLKYPPILQNCVSLAGKARFVMLRYPKFIEIWSLGQTEGQKDAITGLFKVDKGAKKLLVLQKVVKVDGVEKKEGIICSAISDDGSLILYSTRLGVRFFKFECEGNTPRLTLIESEELRETPCVYAKFMKNNRAVLAPNSGGLQIVAFDTSSCNGVLIQNISTGSELEDTVIQLTVSDCGQFLVAGDVKGNIAVWILKKDQYVFHCKLPKYKLSPTAMAIHPTLLNLVVTYNNNNLIEYDLNRRGLTKFSRIFSKTHPEELTSGRFLPIRNISFDPVVNNLIILHYDDIVIVINKGETVTSNDSKIQKPSNNNLPQFAVRSIKKYKHLVHLSWLSDDEMVAVEVNPLSLLEQVPPCLFQNTFGRK